MLASTTQGLGGPELALEDDLLVSERVRAAVPAPWRDRVRIRRGYVSAGDYLSLAAAHTAVVSMRMHGAILGAVAGAGVVLANGSSKARGLRARTGGALYSIDGSAELRALDEPVRHIMEGRRAWRRRQAAGVETMRAAAARSSALVADRLASGGGPGGRG
jgi:polysaccharide pyruvyl transferase WcaK-like protein